jgi:hypothetical protein
MLFNVAFSRICLVSLIGTFEYIPIFGHICPLAKNVHPHTPFHRTKPHPTLAPSLTLKHAFSASRQTQPHTNVPVHLPCSFYTGQCTVVPVLFGATSSSTCVTKAYINFTLHNTVL